MPSFVKISSGLVKMYQEEVLGKLVVVQHLWLEPWDTSGRRSVETLPLERLRTSADGGAGPEQVGADLGADAAERKDAVDQVNKVWKEMQAGDRMPPPPMQGLPPSTSAPWKR